MYVVVDMQGGSYGVFTKLRRAQACVVNAERQWGVICEIHKHEVNEDGTQNEASTEGDAGPEGPEEAGAQDEAS